ncbi:hypothetical protein FSARC_13997 [Fusarium sarcochroum]|uniref:AAA+ ATPase domain-containing protein n=1 Tax=Fusarium sarcochroum TaxID=1208366 RepID=A0A8H4SWY4_9HYPO|nr:hypothetical protein FSARC_13997 [Fusarium sarcochroum]
MASKDSNVADYIPSPSASPPDADSGQAQNSAARSDTLADRQKPPLQQTAGFADEIHSLKQKIAELERQHHVADGNLEEDSKTKEAARASEEYKRREAYLYEHRKQWETNTGPGKWSIPILENNDFTFDRYQYPLGPWSYHWGWNKEREYQRPDPFSPAHYPKGHGAKTGAKAPDEFDYTIDFGARRESLRKNFEWEMDRLYLVEETDRRRRQKEKEEHEKAAQPDKDQTEKQLALLHEPKLDRVDWFSFTRVPSADEEHGCLIHILTGEPIMDEDSFNRHWFGYSKRQEPRLQTQRIDYTISPLPERIRIRSGVLLQILTTILGPSPTVLGDTETNTVVLLRPFKSLQFCQEALHDWCAALEEKFRPSTEHEVVQEVKGSSTEAVSASPDDKQPEGGIRREQSHHETSENGSESRKDPIARQSYTAGEYKATNEPPLFGKNDSRDARENKEKEDNPDDVTKSPIALKHLRCLLDFINSDFVAKQTYLRDPLSDKVVFSDLWHLFRPGMEVIGSDGKQAYRVIGVSSARHRVASPQELWYNPLTIQRKSENRDSGEQKRKKPPFSITCVYIDFDGKHIGPVTKVFNFRRFDGEKNITSLDVYPLHFYPIKQFNRANTDLSKGESLPKKKGYRDYLIERGAKFLEVATVKHKYYTGPSVETQEQIESQVVIDFETAFSVDDEMQKALKPELQTLVGSSFDGDDDDENSTADDEACQGECCRDEPVYDDGYIDQRQRSEYITSLLPRTGDMNKQPSVAIISQPLEELRSGPNGELTASDSELVIMSYRVFGFVLRTRRWAQLDVSYLSDVHSNGVSEPTTDDEELKLEKEKPVTPFDHLVLEKGHKKIIKSLIAQHFRDKKMASGQTDQFDIVKGKGKSWWLGLILLLHGAPGVGKTSTAEGVAELFQKPLFQITCGDLGTTASEVETALERNFALANRWDCILLLDEADVFLAERTKEDFTRNGLVAVFLRVMEYYAGILFLTTNRVGDFDEAFTSRIHISLYYPELNRDKTVEVFKINLAMIEERFAKRSRRIDIDKMRIGSFAAEHFLDHPNARWNGRQIRNACQTALALAEFEAQGSSHEAILKPNAVVTLDVRHFEVVRNAYLEFTDYMNQLYGTDTARRAKESRLRAVLVDENNRVVGSSASGDKKMDFFLASQPSGSRQQRPMPAPMKYQGHQNQQDFPQPGLRQQPQYQQQQQQQAGDYQHQYHRDFSPQYQVYSGSNQGQSPAQQYPEAHGFAGSDGRANYAPFKGSAEGHQRMGFPSQRPPTTPPPPLQREHEQSNPEWFSENIQTLYDASSPQPRGREGGYHP